MKKYFLSGFLALTLVGVFILVTDNEVWAGHLDTAGEPHVKKKDRPFYSYKGNYRDEINSLKQEFQKAFGYELIDLDTGWRPAEIKKLHAAFAQLPENFYRIKQLKGFYRASAIKLQKPGPGAQDIPDSSGIPAATFPRFTTVYRQAHQSYQVALADEPLRIEFYNSIFYEGPDDFDNIVHHEMGHIYDLSHGFLTFQKDWLALTGFRILHLPALDGKADSDFLYTLINDAGILNYGPVSSRHLPTYSRENPQEDFANSAAAYIHYPYFQYTHPRRYRFIKDKVFGGKEYFKAGGGDYATVILNHLNKALADRDWSKVIRLAREQSRFLNTALEKKMVFAMQKAVDQKISAEADLQLTKASCYLIHPDALALRKGLWVARRIQMAKVLQEDRCRLVNGRAFEGNQVRWPMMQVRFYREEGRTKVQFLDPAALTAYARGYKTLYRWQLSVTTPRSRVVSKGEVAGPDEPNGAFVIDLRQTVVGRYKFPGNREVILEVHAVRTHPQAPKPLESQLARLQLVVQPDFEYLGPLETSFQIIHPPAGLSQP